MDQKIKNTLIIVTILIFIIISGGVYSFVMQKGYIDGKKQEIKDLNLNAYNTADLEDQLKGLQKRAAELDSILNLRKFNIPVNLHQSKFYGFINKVSFGFSPQSYVNIEYENINSDENFQQYQYKLNGVAYFNDLYKLIFAIEQSKELKKVTLIWLKIPIASLNEIVLESVTNSSCFLKSPT